MDSAKESRGVEDLLPTIAILAAFLLLGALVYFLYSRQSPDTRAWGGNSPEQRIEWLQETRAHEAAQLEGYGWIDREAGMVRLPIDRAMELTVEELNQGGNEN